MSLFSFLHNASNDKKHSQNVQGSLNCEQSGDNAVLVLIIYPVPKKVQHILDERCQNQFVWFYVYGFSIDFMIIPQICLVVCFKLTEYD